jgi:hypothetical protein
MTHRPSRLHGAALLLGLLAAACAPGDPQPGVEEVSAGLPEGHPAIGAMGAPGTALTGVVEETMDGGGYTFALLDVGDRELWVAGPMTQLTVGAAVSLPDTMNMGQFTAASLNRTFDVLYFTGGFSTAAPASIESLEFQGTVKETMVSGGYTYVLVEADGTSIWLAAPDGDFQVGQAVAWNGGIAMPNFHSNTLDRTFETIYFVEAVTPVAHPGG